VEKIDHCVLELVFCRIHCKDQSKTFFLLLKSKILDFETLSRVHVYRIEYVSYWQGPYRIRIDTADDRIVPALISRVEGTSSDQLLRKGNSKTMNDDPVANNNRSRE